MSIPHIHGHLPTKFTQEETIAIDKEIKALGHLFSLGKIDDFYDLVTQNLAQKGVFVNKDNPQFQAKVKETLGDEVLATSKFSTHLIRGTRRPRQAYDVTLSPSAEAAEETKKREAPLKAALDVVLKLIGLKLPDHFSLREPGVFRETAEGYSHAKFKKATSEGALRALAGSPPDPLAVSCIIKSFYRELPNDKKLAAPLTNLPKASIVGAATVTLNDQLLSAAIAQIKTLIQDKHEIQALIHLLHALNDEKVKEFQSVGLALSIGPSIFIEYEQPSGADHNALLQTSGKHSKDCGSTLQFILENYDGIFS